MNKTEIFKDYAEFLKREDKTINGVSKAFSEEHPGYEEQNATNRGCWNCSNCFECQDCECCIACISCSGCFNCRRCKSCKGIWDLTDRDFYWSF